MPNGTVRTLYKIILGLGAQVSQTRDVITTYYIHGGYMYQNHFKIDYEKGCIDHYGPEQMVHMSDEQNGRSG